MRQAQQILSLGTIVFVLEIVFALQAVPANVISSLTYAQFLLIAMTVIAVLDAILLGLSLVSFQRSEQRPQGSPRRKAVAHLLSTYS